MTMKGDRAPKKQEAIATMHSSPFTGNEPMIPLTRKQLAVEAVRLLQQFPPAIAHPSRTQPQQALYDALPPRHTGLNAPKHYEALTALSDDVCHALLPLAHALSGSDCGQAIQARVKLEQLVAMAPQDILKAFQIQQEEQGGKGGDRNGGLDK